MCLVYDSEMISSQELPLRANAAIRAAAQAAFSGTGISFRSRRAPGETAALCVGSFAASPARSCDCCDGGGAGSAAGGRAWGSGGPAAAAQTAGEEGGGDGARPLNRCQRGVGVEGGGDGGDCPMGEGAPQGEGAPHHLQVLLGAPHNAHVRNESAGKILASFDEGRGELLKEEGGGASGGVMQLEEVRSTGGGEGADAAQGSSEGEVEAEAGEDLGRARLKRPSFPEQGRGRSVRTRTHTHACRHTHTHALTHAHGTDVHILISLSLSLSLSFCLPHSWYALASALPPPHPRPRSRSSV